MVNTLKNFNNIEQIKYPLITDKTTRLLRNNQYTFLVDPKISKTEIKQTLEFFFNVEIIKINTLHLPRKQRRVGKFTGTKSHYKKAIIKLAEGYSIKLFSQN